MREEETTFENGPVRLAGTLTLPQGVARCPAVLFLHGSGPLDRNENVPGQRLDIFNALAHRLAGAGFASLRYDKRGCGASTGDYYTAGQAEFLTDAHAGLRHLDAALGPRLTHRFVTGHSEGTLLAARLSQQARLDGLVLLAPFIAPVETMLMAQARRLEAEARAAPGLSGVLGRVAMAVLGSPTRAQARLIARLKSGDKASFRVFFRRVEAKSLRELMALDSEAIYRQVASPMLVLGGTNDIQCDPGDVARIAAIAGSLADPVVVGGLTHVLRRGSASFAAVPALLKQGVDPDVLVTVSDWLTQKARASAAEGRWKDPRYLADRTAFTRVSTSSAT